MPEMPDTIGYSQACRMLHAAAAQIRAQHEMLSRLDSAVGDGDHGTTMLRAMEAVAKAVSENQGAELKPLFSSVAWAFLSCDGGSTGPLLGSFFVGMSDACAGKNELDRAGWAAVFEGGVLRMQKQSRAQIGDKTMMDAFLPALAALQSASEEGGLKAALRQAADAALKGAEATKNMRAKFGRARNLGDRVLGHLDPGAVSVSLICQGFSEGFA
jgi:phosphoenolpyruvate---glycerone phosphotransferase subunit DhaL